MDCCKEIRVTRTGKFVTFCICDGVPFERTVLGPLVTRATLFFTWYCLCTYIVFPHQLVVVQMSYEITWYIGI